jgi:phage terminase small subunit
MARSRQHPPAAPDPADAPLTPRERRFVDEYLVDLNATRAYLAAHPRTTYTAARVGGSRLVAKANIRAEIRAGRDAQQRRTRVRADDVLREIARVAFSDVFYLVDDDDRLLPLRRVPFETRRAVASVRVLRERTTTRSTTRNGTRTRTVVSEQVIEYKLWNKIDALRQLCAHLGLDAGLPPLEVLLSLLPRDLSAELRAALAAPPGRNGAAAVDRTR